MKKYFNMFKKKRLLIILIILIVPFFIYLFSSSGGLKYEIIKNKIKIEIGIKDYQDLNNKTRLSFNITNLGTDTKINFRNLTSATDNFGKKYKLDKQWNEDQKGPSIGNMPISFKEGESKSGYFQFKKIDSLATEIKTLTIITGKQPSLEKYTIENVVLKKNEFKDTIPWFKEDDSIFNIFVTVLGVVSTVLVLLFGDNIIGKRLQKNKDKVE